MKQATADAIQAHRAAGREFSAGGVRSFVREQGEGEPVVLVHGVPTSSYLYRKMLRPLADAGHRAVAFDFPGLGLAERPEGFDYSWSGLASWMAQALDELGIERCHLVVHDIGGPIGFEWAIENSGAVRSLTALNTWVDAGEFRRPWPMKPFAIPGLGRLYLSTLTPFAMRQAFYLQGIGDRSATSPAELEAYYHLLKRGDGGSAFLEIMRGFELTAEKERFFLDGLAELACPRQVVWGRNDPALGKRRLGVQAALGVQEPILLEAKHFLQEDQAPEIAGAVDSLIRRSAA